MPYYICTNCTRPTDTLYKVYSTPGSIQLTTCQNCGHDVDSYIEREWLLVTMDCVLHRPEAFRHMLYNREPFCRFGSTSEEGVSVKESSDNEQKNKNCQDSSNMDMGTTNYSGWWYQNDSLKRLIRYSALASLLRTYIWYVAKGTGREDHELLPELVIVLLQSFVGEVTMLLTTILSGSFFLEQAQASQPNNDSSKNASSDEIEMGINSKAFFYSRLHLALTIPVFFHIATIFALIWENSSTVSLLGTLFVLSLQYMGVSIVMQEQLNRVCDPLDKDSINNDSRVERQERSVWICLPHSFPFIVGIIVRTLFVHITAQVLGSAITMQGSLACTGILLPTSVLFATGSICVQ